MFLQLLQLQLMLLACTWCVSAQQYTYSQELNAAVPVPPRFLVPGAYLAPAPDQSYQLQPQGKKLQPNADVSSSAEYDDRRYRRPFVGRRRPDEPAVSNTASALPATVTETYRPSTWSTPLLLQQSPQSSAPVASSVSPFVYSTTTQRIGSAGDTNTPAISTVPDSNSAEESFTRKLPGIVTPYRPTKVQYFPINNPNIIDEHEETAVFHNVKTENPYISSTSATPETSSPNHIQRTKPFTSRFGANSIRTPQPQQKVRSRPPSQPVILPPTPPQSRSSFEQTADTDNKITRTYDSSPRQDSNQQRGKRIKKPVAQVLRKYRDDNPDGSITWGFENDDGSYKEETIGNDCVTRGKYGYIDPDGVHRQYSYVQGLPCDRNKLKQEEEEDEDINGDEPEPQTLVKHRARKPVQKF